MDWNKKKFTKIDLSCRLCVDLEGVYQIDPDLQHMIKYCFDINIHTFDGMSQTICDGCTIILKDTAATKKRFVDNQTVFLKRLEQSKIFESGVEDHKKTKSADNNFKPIQAYDGEKKDMTEKRYSVKRKRILSTSSESSGDQKPKSTALIKYEEDDKQSKVFTEGNNLTWREIYDRKFVCRFCMKQCRSRKSILRHLKTHKQLQITRSTYVKQHCVVQMEKFDAKPNITGEDNTVALNSDTILFDKGNVNYFVTYIAKREFVRSSVNGCSSVTTGKDGNIIMDSDLFNDGINSKPRKRIRLNSRSSSTETLVMDSTNNARSSVVLNTQKVAVSKINSQNTTNDLINIDDSSNDTIKSNFDLKLKEKSKESEIKTIMNVTSMCYEKHVKSETECQKERSLNDVTFDGLLNKKLLSIGRKVMSSKGLDNPKGLLKFLEHKHLPMHWSPVDEIKTVVRIMTKLREKSESDILSGWILLKEFKDSENLEETKNADFPKVIADLTFGELQRMKNVYGMLRSDPKTSDSQNNQVGSKIIKNDCSAAVHSVNNSLPLLPTEDPSAQQNVTVSFPPANVSAAPVAAAPVSVSSLLAALASPSPMFDTTVQPLMIITETKSLAQQAILKSSFTNTEKGISQIETTLHMPDLIESDLYKNKLLNASPVANPKQLPKKHGCYDIKPNIQNATDSNTAGNFNSVQTDQHINVDHLFLLDSDVEVSGENLMRMPIITSTTSLAEAVKTDKDIAQVSGNIPTEIAAMQPESDPQSEPIREAPIGRIKCKPVSELMKCPTNSTPITPFKVLSKPLKAVNNATNINASSVLGGNINNIALGGNMNNIVLHSVDLPYTITSNPIKYFANLLQMRKLILITDVNATLTPEYVCLVKFRLDVSQENKSVALCLTLFAHENIFCLKVKNIDLDEINMNTLPAYWQMHILNAFLGDVADKIMQCALKVSVALYNNTKQFVYLLKTIESKSPAVTR